MTNGKIAELLNAFRCQWPRDWPHGEATTTQDVKTLSNLYRMALSAIPDTDFDTLLTALMQNCKYRPVPAEVIEAWLGGHKSSQYPNMPKHIADMPGRPYPFMSWASGHLGDDWLDFCKDPDKFSDSALLKLVPPSQEIIDCIAMWEPWRKQIRPDMIPVYQRRMAEVHNATK